MLNHRLPLDSIVLIGGNRQRDLVFGSACRLFGWLTFPYEQPVTLLAEWFPIDILLCNYLSPVTQLIVVVEEDFRGVLLLIDR